MTDAVVACLSSRQLHLLSRIRQHLHCCRYALAGLCHILSSSTATNNDACPGVLLLRLCTRKLRNIVRRRMQRCAPQAPRLSFSDPSTEILPAPRLSLQRQPSSTTTASAGVLTTVVTAVKPSLSFRSVQIAARLHKRMFYRGKLDTP